MRSDVIAVCVLSGFLLGALTTRYLVPPKLVVQQIEAERVGAERVTHDAAWATYYQGVLALGLVLTNRDLRVGSEGDMAVIRLDRQTGRVLAKCE